MACSLLINYIANVRFFYKKIAFCVVNKKVIK